MIGKKDIISDELKVAQTFNNYFVNIVPSLKINSNKDFLTDTKNQEDPIKVIIEKFKSHPSILEINNKNSKTNKFGFALVTKDCCIPYKYR